MDPVNVALAPDRCNDRWSAFGGLVPTGSQITQSVAGDADQCIEEPERCRCCRSLGCACECGHRSTAVHTALWSRTNNQLQPDSATAWQLSERVIRTLTADRLRI